MIEKVISGGQIGADQAALFAAKQAGIPTGGWAPAGFKTLRGDQPDLAELYGLVDSESRYSIRTEWNVRDSDGTIRFAVNFNSPGERSTKTALLRHHKPYFDVLITRQRGDEWWVDEEAEVEWAAEWIRDKQIRVLNVAGNGRSDIEAVVIDYLGKLFALLKEEK